MKLNRVEKWLMNNPIRSRVQRLEARVLRTLGGDLAGRRVLEVGCGRGVGTELILDVFGAERVDAFDLDPDMVRRARRRLGSRGDRVRLWTGDVTRIDVPDASYDAVFDFAIIHHVPRWREALREIERVLAPGGRFLGEEVLRDFILHPLARRLLDHPLEDRFDHDGFRDALVEAGLSVVATRSLARHMAFFVAEKPGREAPAAGSHRLARAG